MLLLDKILDSYPDMNFTTADGFDEAVIGVDEKVFKLIYSVNKIIEILMLRDGMTEPEAFEFFDYNVAGAYVSDDFGNDVTPIYCFDCFS